MKIFLIITINIAWIAYSMIEGVRDGFYRHLESNSRRHLNFEINLILLIQRSIILTFIGIILYELIGWKSIISIFSMILIFNYFYAGAYYTTRNKLNDRIYIKGWCDQSNTPTNKKKSKIMTYINRKILMILGILIQILTLSYL
jgi:hypothetical protein